MCEIDDRFQVINEIPSPNLVYSADYLGVDRGPWRLCSFRSSSTQAESVDVKTALYARIAAKSGRRPVSVATTWSSTLSRYLRKTGRSATGSSATRRCLPRRHSDRGFFLRQLGRQACDHHQQRGMFRRRAGSATRDSAPTPRGSTHSGMSSLNGPRTPTSPIANAPTACGIWERLRQSRARSSPLDSITDPTRRSWARLSLTGYRRFSPNSPVASPAHSVRSRCPRAVSIGRSNLWR